MDPFGYKSQKTQPKLAHVTRLHMDQELLGSAHWGLSSIFWLSIYPFDLIFRLSVTKMAASSPINSFSQVQIQRKEWVLLLQHLALSTALAYIRLAFIESLCLGEYNFLIGQNWESDTLNKCPLKLLVVLWANDKAHGLGFYDYFCLYHFIQYLTVNTQ